MKIVNIIGGLGNQMFCYAFAKSLKNKYPTESIMVDISHFNHYGLHAGFQINEIFKNVDIDIANPKCLSKVTWFLPHYGLSRLLRRILPVRKTEYLEKKDYVFNADVFNIKTDCYYEGYWQSPFYFNDIERDIKDMFTFPEPQEENSSLASQIKNVSSVAIHIRRGDYLNAKSFMGICNLDYYKQAICYIEENIDNPVYFIFSNDIEWCAQNIAPLTKKSKIVFVTHNVGKSSYWDMYLMSCCKGMILANSSFSWWGAYLNKNLSPLIIAPAKWVNRNYRTEVHLNQWIKI